MNTKVLLHCQINYFHQILKNCHFGVRKKSFLTHMVCMTHIWSPTLFSRGIITFQGVLTKFNFLMKFPHLEKNCQFNEIPKI